jgi:16S rRNA (guanine527-N7)-methyltransferase
VIGKTIRRCKLRRAASTIPNPMRAEHIAELLEPFLGRKGPEQLADQNLERISMYIEILLRWNAKINLTAIRDPEEIVTRHFGESFLLALQLFPGARRGRPDSSWQSSTRLESKETACRLADLGTGAGFPGIPIAIWNPAVSVTLIEANHKKAIFLREVVRNLGLTRVNVENVRGETLASEEFDIVTLRAVERFKEAFAVAAHLIRPSGRLALLISSSQATDVQTNCTNFAWSATQPIPLSEQRIVLIGTRNQND